MLLKAETEDTSSMIGRVGADCPPDQMYRELTHNSIEAIQRMNAIGAIHWTHVVVGGVRKLCLIDNGCGMSAEHAVDYVRNMACSGGVISNFGGNYGVGAKVSAGVKNPEGVEYQTWKDGVGTRLIFCREGNDYGLRQLRPGLSGKDSFYEVLSPEDKPEGIAGDHGTMVILHGTSADEDTVSASRAFLSANQSEAEYDSLRWLVRYLNTRYLVPPTGVVIKVWEERNTAEASWRTIQGEKALLEKNSDVWGSQKLDDVTIHWYIHKDNTHNGSTEYYTASPFTAAIYNGELYDQTRGKEAIPRIQNFGVVTGSNRVVLLFELHDIGVQVTTDTARTHLLRNGRELPYAEWAEIFADNLPDEIIKLMESIRAKKAPPRDNEKRIRDLWLWLSPPQHRASKNGKKLFDPAAQAPGTLGGDNAGDPDRERPARNPKHKPDAESGPEGTNQSGKKSRQLIMPTIQWVSVADGTRREDDMVHSAGRYLRAPNHIVMNADFEIFKRFFEKLQAGHPRASKEMIEGWMRHWIGERVRETATLIVAQSGRDGWVGADVMNRLTEECITACCMSFREVENSCNRDIETNLSRGIGLRKRNLKAV